MAVQLVTIEGNIGTGKSTLANHVAQYMPSMTFFAAPEPEDNPHWQAFLAEPSSHALALQTWFLRERLRVYIRALRHLEQTKESVILDFSIWSDLIFAAKHREDGYLSDAEYSSYQELARSIHALNLPPPHLSIVLLAGPDICLERCKSNRKRKTSKPQLSHLQRLDELYEERWLRDLDKSYKLRWLHGQRSSRGCVGEDKGGLPSAPSLLVLVRDWSDLSNTKPSAIADAIMCTPPVPTEEWLSRFNAAGNEERVRVLLEA